jgi:hypothetical protein
VNETQLIDLLKEQIRAESEAQIEQEQIDKEHQVIEVRLNDAYQRVRRIKADQQDTRTRLMTVIRGNPDPGPKTKENA